MDDEDFNVSFKWDEEIGWVFVSNVWTNAPQYDTLANILIGACRLMDGFEVTPEGLKGTPE